MFLDILYPPRCVYCYDILGVGGPEFECVLCAKEIEFINGKVCIHCGQPMDENIEACTGCRKREFYFSRNHALFVYERSVRAAIHRFKYRNKRKYAKYFGILASEHFKEIIINADIISEIPMHKKKIRARGYNQSELLASEIAKNSNVEHIRKLLIRTKNTKAQSKLSGYIARENNIKNAFELSKDINVTGRIVILVDDIFTTGSTLNECARVLCENGAKEVIGVTLSITLKNITKPTKTRLPS